jgi:hypothetical protein
MECPGCITGTNALRERGSKVGCLLRVWLGLKLCTDCLAPLVCYGYAMPPVSGVLQRLCTSRSVLPVILVLLPVVNASREATSTMAHPTSSRSSSSRRVRMKCINSMVTRRSKCTTALAVQHQPVLAAAADMHHCPCCHVVSLVPD